MTLGNMRANGVRTLAAWCLGRGYAATRKDAMEAIKLAWSPQDPPAPRP
jgi:hypothetical protein